MIHSHTFCTKSSSLGANNITILKTYFRESGNFRIFFANDWTFSDISRIGLKFLLAKIKKIIQSGKKIPREMFRNLLSAKIKSKFSRVLNFAIFEKNSRN